MAADEVRVTMGRGLRITDGQVGRPEKPFTSSFGQIDPGSRRPLRDVIGTDWGPAALAVQTDEALVEGWLQGYAPKTRSAFQADMSAFMGHLGRRRLARATEEDVSDFLEKAPTEAVRRRRLGVVKTFYAQASGKGQIQGNPAAGLHNDKSSWDRTAYRSVDAATIREMLRTTDRLRDRVALQLVYSCALTADEVLDLTWDDVVVGTDGPLLQVQGPHPRTLTLPSAVAKDLSRLRDGAAGGDLVLESRFGDRLSVRQFNRILSDMGDAVGVEGVTPGRVRNAYAEHALASGAPLDEVHHRLGNHSIKSTALRLQALGSVGKGIASGRGTKVRMAIPVPVAKAVWLRDEDFAREAEELSGLAMAAKLTPAQRKRLYRLRERLAAEMERRLSEEEKLPPGHRDMPRFVPMTPKQVGKLLDLVAEAGTLARMRTESATDSAGRAFHRGTLPLLDELQALLERHAAT